MSVEVRPLQPGEERAVGALTLRAYDAVGRVVGPYRAWLAHPERRVDGATAVLVAEVDGVIAGTVTFVLPGDEHWEGRRPSAGDCGFRVLAVDPSCQGRGVGDALVTDCIDRGVGDGRRRMVITSMAWMQRAHGMYVRRGFVHRPDLDVAFPSGIGRTFTKDLSDDAPDHFPPPGPIPDEPPWYEDAWVR